MTCRNKIRKIIEGHELLYSDLFTVKVKILLNSSPVGLPQLASSLQLSRELLCSDVFTVKVKIQLNLSPQLAST